MIRVLFIEGPLDGQRLDLDDTYTQWKVFVPYTEIVGFGSVGGPMVAPEREVVTYSMRRGSDGRMDMDTHFIFERTGLIVWRPE